MYCSFEQITFSGQDNKILVLLYVAVGILLDEGKMTLVLIVD